MATDRLLKIVADTPSLDPGLGFSAYAQSLAAAIRGGMPAQFTIGIYGAWGSGKSSLLNAIAAELRDDPTVLTVTFDAWRYERADHIVVPLLHAVHEAIPRLRDHKLTEAVTRAMVSVAKGLSFKLGPVNYDPRVTLEHFKDASAKELDDAYSRPYRDMRAVGEALGDRRIAVLIDDLDRCSPTNVVAVLEAINLVMDVPGFVFVLALDYEVLVNAVTTRYPHTSGHVFIEKMVQVPFRVPRLSLQPTGFLSELIPNWKEHEEQLPKGFSATAFDVCTNGLQSNPRQIKRFINTMYVLSNIADATSNRIEPELLAGVVGLQLRWPAEYQDLVEAVFAGDDKPAESLLAADSPDLARYAKRFFNAAALTSSLRDVLVLTQAVASPQAESGYDTGEYDFGATSAAEVREDHRKELQERLLKEGFVPSLRYPEAYYKSTIKDCRIKFGKTVVRFEGKERDGHWGLGISFLLTREHKKALRLIGDERQLRALVRLAASGWPDLGDWVRAVSGEADV
jgi:hypothetical protein